MVIALSIVIVAMLIGIPWYGYVLLRRALRAIGPIHQPSPQALIPFGGLPDLGPIGPLGNLSPSATIGDPNASPHDLYDR